MINNNYYRPPVDRVGVLDNNRSCNKTLTAETKREKPTITKRAKTNTNVLDIYLNEADKKKVKMSTTIELGSISIDSFAQFRNRRATM